MDQTNGTVLSAPFSTIDLLHQITKNVKHAMRARRGGRSQRRHRHGKLDTAKRCKAVLGVVPPLLFELLRHYHCVGHLDSILVTGAVGK